MLTLFPEVSSVNLIETIRAGQPAVLISLIKLSGLLFPILTLKEVESLIILSAKNGKKK